MPTSQKTAQLQIRVSAADKAAIQAAAARARMDMSAFVLSRVLSMPARQFQDCVTACAGPDARHALAELNQLLSTMGAAELHEAVGVAPNVALAPLLANYVAAMVELACARQTVAVPAWTRTVAPLREPAFGTSLHSLRLHVLTHSPAPFRCRNIFIDATLGDRV